MEILLTFQPSTIFKAHYGRIIHSRVKPPAYRDHHRRDSYCLALYLIRKHFWRIFLVLVLTCIGYYLYVNGYFTKEKLQGIKSVDFTKIEKEPRKN